MSLSLGLLITICCVGPYYTRHSRILLSTAQWGTWCSSFRLSQEHLTPTGTITRIHDLSSPEPKGQVKYKYGNGPSVVVAIVRLFYIFKKIYL